MVAKNDIKDCKDTDGKRFAIHGEAATTSLAVKLWLLNDCKVKPNIMVIPGGENRIVALQNNQIDATLVQLGDWLNLDARAPGRYHIIRTGNLFNISGASFWANVDWLRKNEEVATAYIAELLKSFRMVHANPKILEPLVAKHLPDMPKDIIAPAIKGYIEIVRAWPQNGGDTSILDDEGDVKQLAPLLADAEIVIGHIWRARFPPAPRLRLLQSVAAGLDLLDTEAVPKGVTICNVFGHDPAIAEYVIMTMLVLTHRLFDAVTAFRAGSWVASPQFGGGPPHGEVMGRTIGIIGYGRIGREVAERAAGLKCRVLAANRSPVADPAPAETVFPLAELDRMLPLCDTVLISCGLAPETKGLIDARRLALMKRAALLINVARAAIVDEDALYAALKDGHLGGAALDVWWQYPTPAEPERRPSRRPFHELPNVLITPHSSSSTEATADRRWSMVAANLDRFARGEKLENIVLQT